MQIGDRVIVEINFTMPSRSSYFHGVIVGERKDGKVWRVLRDGSKHPRPVHKSFCRPEVQASKVEGA